MPRILLVEDNEMNRDMLSRRLTRKGFGLVCYDGVLSLWRNDRLLHRVRDKALTDGFAFIGVRAQAITNDRERALAAGCDDYDTKPVDLARLLDKMQVALAGSRR